MSVLIRGMEMPKCCNDCLLNGCDHWETFELRTTRRSDDCPLEEVIICADCAHYSVYGNGCQGMCNLYDTIKFNEEYCNEGRRKDGWPNRQTSGD